VLRVTTLKPVGTDVANVIGYYAGLAEDQQRRDGVSRGPVDYYLDPDEPPGRWWGSGLQAVGLAGEVKTEQLRAMLDARHPKTGRPLGRGFGISSARGFDATFSAPKSVSVLWALSPDPFVQAEVLAAHDAAVTSALGWLERHGAVTRRGTDGTNQLDTRGLAVALFRQHTSRSVDPQLHTHALIWSKVQDPSGRWLSLDARFLKYEQRAIGWIYDAALRVELTTRLGLGWEPCREGHSDIEGIGPELRELYSKRSEQLRQLHATYIRRWVETHDGADPSPRKIAELQRRAVKRSRPPKTHGIEAHTLRVEWMARAREVGIDLPRLPVADRRPRVATPLRPRARRRPGAGTGERALGHVVARGCRPRDRHAGAAERGPPRRGAGRPGGRARSRGSHALSGAAPRAAPGYAAPTRRPADQRARGAASAVQRSSARAGGAPVALWPGGRARGQDGEDPQARA
jgi:conjugative relaxase-like TrwC/TraI family protein